MRRRELAAILTGLMARRALGAPTFSPNMSGPPLFPRVPFTLDTHISYGQSWRGEAFASFTSPYGINPQSQTLLTPHVPTTGAFGPPGPLPIGAGVSLPANINGITGYQGTDQYSIGRAAVLSQQLLRLRAGDVPLDPILEMCFAFGGSTWTTGGGGGLGPNTASFTASVADNLLTVESTPTPVSITENQGLYGSTINRQTQILFTGTGTGGAGTYSLTRGGWSISSQALTSSSVSWTNQTTVLSQLAALLPEGIYQGFNLNSVGYTQGGSADNTIVGKVADLTAMFTLYDGHGYPGGPINYYLGVAAINSFATTLTQGGLGTPTFCRTNAPGAGGTWSGRCFAATPWYQWPFCGPDQPLYYGSLHTAPYGIWREGEKEGYVRRLVQDLNVAWTPLWRSSAPITRSGQVVTVPFSRPAGSDFAATPMVFQSLPNDGVKVWPNFGFDVSRAGVHLTLSSVVISGLNVQLTVQQTINNGDTLEVSYAFYGPGGPNPGLCSGVGGNLVMNGPASVFFPGNTIDDWAWPFDETITA